MCYVCVEIREWWCVEGSDQSYLLQLGNKIHKYLLCLPIDPL